MNEENQVSSLPEIETTREPVPDKESEYIERTHNFLSSLSPGNTIVVERLKPAWCKGFLDEFELSEPLTITYFIETWGGEELLVRERQKNGQLHGSYKIPLHSYPPRRNGLPIKRYESYMESQPENGKPPITTVVNSPQPSVESSKLVEKLISALPVVLPLVFKWFDGAERRRREETDRIVELLSKNIQQNPMADLAKIMPVISQFSAINGNGGRGNADNEQDQVFGMIEKVLNIFANREVTKPSKLISGETKPQSLSLSQAVSQLEPNQAIGCLQEALGYMPIEKRAATMEQLVGQIEQIGGAELLLQVLEDKGILEKESDQEDNYDDESDDPKGLNPGRPD